MGEMERKQGREGEGECECAAPREHTVLDGIVVHLCVCVCMCTECGELPWPWPGAPLSEVLWLSSQEEGVIPGGDTTPYVLPESSSMNKAC